MQHVKKDILVTSIVKRRFGRRALFLIYICVASSVPVLKANAITMDKSYYTSDEHYYTTSSGPNPIILYNVDSGDQLLSLGSYSEGDDLTVINTPGHYSVVEVSSG